MYCPVPIDNSVTPAPKAQGSMGKVGQKEKSVEFDFLLLITVHIVSKS